MQRWSVRSSLFWIWWRCGGYLSTLGNDLSRTASLISEIRTITTMPSNGSATATPYRATPLSSNGMYAQKQTVPRADGESEIEGSTAAQSTSRRNESDLREDDGPISLPIPETRIAVCGGECNNSFCLITHRFATSLISHSSLLGTGVGKSSLLNAILHSSSFNLQSRASHC